jgi:hypothetical protein
MLAGAPIGLQERADGLTGNDQKCDGTYPLRRSADSPRLTDPVSLERWRRDFVKVVLQRYGSKLQGIVAVQAWNEPNLRTFWGGEAGEPARFAEVVNATSAAVRSERPNIGVLPGAMSPEGSPVGEFISASFNPNHRPHIGANRVDGIATHHYAPRVGEMVEQWDKVTQR